MSERLLPARPARVPDPAPAGPAAHVAVLTAMPQLQEIAAEWDALAGSHLFSTVDWLSSWWEAYGRGRPAVLVVRDPSGALVAGLACREVSRGVWAAMANQESGQWGAVAASEGAERLLWQALARSGVSRLRAECLLERDGNGTATMREELGAAGYRVVPTRGSSSPYVALPSTFDELMSSFGSRLRRQLRQSGRRLDGLGELRLRVVRGGPELPAALDSVLALESGGWKNDAGTAVLRTPPLERLYRAFAARAGEQGRLRLHLLELDGRPVVGSFGCVAGGVGHLMKTGFDERLAEHSPGIYLLGEILRLSIEEGLAGCDLLGSPDPWKLRFTDTVRPRVGLRAYRGLRSLPESLYWTHGRPALKWAAVRTVRRPAADASGRPPSAASDR